MNLGLQNGIYYLEGQRPRNSFCVLFLRIKQNSVPTIVKDILLELWTMYKDLEKGMLKEFKDLSRSHRLSPNLYTGNLSTLVGYGPGIFDMPGIKRHRPSYLEEKWLFRMPNKDGGGALLDDIGLSYAGDVFENPVSEDHIVIQFIGDNELTTNRAVVETWKLLRKVNEDPARKDNVFIRVFYTGFSRPDNRSWLGFHDGVSNIQNEDRFKTISISNADIPIDDRWTANGTYLAFLRIAINLDLWERIPMVKQERIVGRDKISGCPLAGVDEKTGTNILIKGCPSPGTYEVTEDANKIFREHPIYGNQRNLPGPISDKELEKSHVGRTYKRNPYDHNSEYRIFRQGYEFLESTDLPPKVRTGLNFVSFQRGTDRLHHILAHGLGESDFGGDPNTNGKETDKLISVRAAGVYLVPPYLRNERFPGEGIFD